MKNEDRQILRMLLTSQPWVSLATADEEGPYGAMVAVAWDSTQQCFLVYLSTLALHTRQLQRRAECCLVFAEPYLKSSDDPQQLARVSVECNAMPITRGQDEFESCRLRYLARFPMAASRFGLGDFLFFQLVPRRGRLVCGFGRALNVQPADIASCWSES